MSQMRIRVTAALVVRNERPYMGNCLRHLIENGIDYVIVDNGSTDETIELLQQPYFAKHLVGYHMHPYQGRMDWVDLMRARQAAADAIDTDWILYVSADEIMHSYNAGETLSAAIERVDAAGFDVIDFNEFVFLPIEIDYLPDREGPQLLRHYYFFEDYRPRLMRARKKRLQISHVEHGGHVLSGEPIRLSPETFALRHYMFRNQTHAFEKYARRVYAAEELARGWHWHGFQHPVANFAFPPAGQLECLASPDDRNLSLAHPHKTPYWMWTTQAIADLRHALAEQERASRQELAILQQVLAEKELATLATERISRQEIANLQHALTSQQQSRSWRWTAPMRRVFSFLRRVRSSGATTAHAQVGDQPQDSQGTRSHRAG
jgi:Glycosyl transferase family 2